MEILNIPVTRVGRINVSKILVVGFNQTTYGVLNKYKNGSRTYVLERMDSSFKAYHHLLEVAKDELPENQPKAILCDLQFLKDDDYRFLKKIQSDKILQNIPFILISTNGATIDPTFALTRGIDDCFSINNLDWNNLKRRVEFLTRFKSEITNNIHKEERDFAEYRIPKGKRIFDILFATTVLVFISPLLLLIALLIKLESKGSIFYSSKRAGAGFQIFDFIKFRSMYQDADKRLQELSHLNQYDSTTDDEGPSFTKLQNDPRVTRIGRIIRKTSLDELPQLLNVLKGDMSIVGNRPLPLYEADQLTSDEWSQRFIAPAGLTGLWQISKRGKKDMSTQERIKLDIDYANKYSLWMDIKILLRTLPAMIQEEQV